MTWIQKYRIRNYIKSCLWIRPALAVVAGWIAHLLIWQVDRWAGWTVLGISVAGARDITGIIAGAMLTFAVFLLSMLLLVVQMASSQLTPLAIARAYQSPVVHRSIAYFTFVFIFAAGTQVRIDTEVHQLSVLCSILLCIGGLIEILRFVDNIGKSLRPVSLVTSMASSGIEVIASVYPNKLDGSKAVNESHHEIVQGEQPVRNIYYGGKAGVFLAFDAAGLVRFATVANCLIQNVPAVGEFVANGDLLFRICGTSDGITDRQLCQHVVMGAERTMEQDPAFVFRMIVDIAIRALSPAVNDPTTAVMAIDQIQPLLLQVGNRDLGDGKVRDSSGNLRLVFPTPNWEDFVSLGVSEVRLYGAGSIQVLRRLRAMLEDLVESLPADRHGPLRVQLSLLEEAASRNFPDAWDRQAAGVGDYQGLGGSRATVHS
jgi:uncharacterized membrane protein